VVLCDRCEVCIYVFAVPKFGVGAELSASLNAGLGLGGNAALPKDLEGGSVSGEIGGLPPPWPVGIYGQYSRGLNQSSSGEHPWAWEVGASVGPGTGGHGTTGLEGFKKLYCLKIE